MTACAPCAANNADVGECDRHTPAVQEVARAIATATQEVVEPTDEMIGWFIQDGLVVAGDWPADVMVVTFTDHGNVGDRRHFTINGQRWAEPDPNAEGFNVLVPMVPCAPCDDCFQTGWIEAP